jgi:hypothetical protein
MKRDLINMNTSILQCHNRNPQRANYDRLNDNSRGTGTAATLAASTTSGKIVIRGDNQFALRANLLPRLENGVSAVIASIHRVRFST